MKNLTKKLPILLLAVFELLVGIMLILIADIFTEIFVILIGVSVIAVGLFQLIGYFRKRGGAESNAFVLTISIVLMIAGLLIACFAKQLVELLKVPFIIYGALLVVFGIYKIGFFFDLKQIGVPTTLLVPISGILSIICGAVIICRPVELINLFWIIVGIVHIAEAVTDIVALFLVSKPKKPVVIVEADNTDDSEQ